MNKYALTQEQRERQQALYRYLLSRGDHWTGMAQATDSVAAYPTYYTGSYHNSHARRMLTADIEVINSSADYEKLIISSSRGIKLATQRELVLWIRSEIREARRKLWRLSRMAKKASRDQQIALDGEIREAFIEERQDG